MSIVNSGIIIIIYSNLSFYYIIVIYNCNYFYFIIFRCIKFLIVAILFSPRTAPPFRPEKSCIKFNEKNKVYLNRYDIFLIPANKKIQ